MEPEGRQEIERIYQLARQREPAERAALLKEACAGNESLRKEVESLLADASGVDSTLGSTAQQVAGRAISRAGTGGPGSQVIGRLLSHYHVLEKIGEGGMGVVYRAHDENLQRNVAIKVLPPGTLGDESARKRFRKEALALSKFSHPNIETVHEFNRQDDLDYLVMEYIPGRTLREKLSKGSMPEGEIAALGLQLAEGLTAAHGRGIVHCDLKPANLLVTPEGRLKILDFGLSKSVDLKQPVNADDVTTLSLSLPGTLPYMSPEQLSYSPVDERTDIYSAGVILYEMAAGRRPFLEKLPSALANEILHRSPPPPSQFKRNISLRLEEIILKCLEKDPANRYQTAREMSVDLRRFSALVSEPIIPTPRPRPLQPGSILVLVAVLMAVLVTVWLWRSRAGNGPVPQFQTHRIVAETEPPAKPSLSPDGGSIAYLSNRMGGRNVFVIRPDESEPSQITTGTATDDDPAWFPDGKTLAFSSDRRGRQDIWQVDLRGKDPALLLEDAGHPAISPDEKWLAFTRTLANGRQRIGVARLPDASDQIIITDDGDGPGNHKDPVWSPDGKMICYSSQEDLWAISPEKGGSATRVTRESLPDVEPAWSPNGYLYFASRREGTTALYRVKASGGTAKRISIGGVAENHPSISRDGTRLVYSTAAADSQLFLCDRESLKETPLSSYPNDIMGSFSQDNSRIVFLSARRSGNISLWMQDLVAGQPAGSPSQLFNLAGGISHPAFSPDDRWIACFRILDGRRDIFMIPIAGGEPVQFTSNRGRNIHPSWSADGTKLAYASDRSELMQIYIAPVENGKRIGRDQILSTKPISAYSPAWSMDGRWIAFMGEVSDEYEVYVMRADGSERANPITRGANAKTVRWDWARNEILASGSWGGDRTTIRRGSPENGRFQPLSPPIDLGSKIMDSPVFNISRDGRLLVFSRESSKNGDILLLTVTKGIW